MKKFKFEKEEVYSNTENKKFVYKVSFEKILRHIFKDTFKTAKWNRNEAVWIVGSRSLNRLQQFEAKVNEDGFVEALEAGHEAELTKKELETLNSDLSELTKRLKINEEEVRAIINESLNSSEVLALISSKQDALVASFEKMKLAKVAAEKEVKAIKDKISLIIDIESIFTAASNMSYHSYKKANKEEFNSEQKVIIEQVKLLEDAGLKSKGLSEFSYLNHNSYVWKNKVWKDLTEFMLFDISEV